MLLSIGTTGTRKRRLWATLILLEADSNPTNRRWNNLPKEVGGLGKRPCEMSRGQSKARLYKHPDLGRAVSSRPSRWGVNWPGGDQPTFLRYEIDGFGLPSGQSANPRGVVRAPRSGPAGARRLNVELQMPNSRLHRSRLSRVLEVRPSEGTHFGQVEALQFGLATDTHRSNQIAELKQNV